MTGRSLLASDEFFKSNMYSGSLNEQAWVSVSKEIDQGITLPENAIARQTELFNNAKGGSLDDVSATMRQLADDEAHYATFTDQPGRNTQAYLKLMGQIPALRMATPFVNTPVNLFKMAFENSPLAPLTTRYKEAIAKGGGAADLARTKMTTGTMAMATMVDYAMGGKVTGAGPRDPKERALWMVDHKPYSLKVGDQWVSYRGFEPFSTLAGWSASMGEWLLNSDFDDPEEVLDFEQLSTAMVVALSDSMLSVSFANSQPNLSFLILSGTQRTLRTRRRSTQRVGLRKFNHGYHSPTGLCPTGATAGVRLLNTGLSLARPMTQPRQPLPRQ
jgi:hypothetical protein